MTIAAVVTLALPHPRPARRRRDAGAAQAIAGISLAETAGINPA
jgi:hypothetical protein